MVGLWRDLGIQVGEDVRLQLNSLASLKSALRTARR